MKYFLRFLTIYLIIIGVIATFYVNINSERKQHLDFTKSELDGVKYLKGIYNIAIDLAIYQGFVETKDSKEKIESSRKSLLSSIDAIYTLQKKYPQFKDSQFNKQLEQIKKPEMHEKIIYEFFDYINHENYRIGDVSKLLFETDRKVYFLGSLITHYMPEYLISVLITHNVAEEFLHKNSISDYKMERFIQHNKLMYLSSEELTNIIKSLKPYDDTKKLQNLMTSIVKELDNSPISRNTTVIKKDAKLAKKYLDVSHRLLELSYQLNDEHISLLEIALKNRKENLENIIYRDMFLVIFILLLITVILYYFYRTFSANLKKDFEIKKTSETLDKLVIFSKTDRAGKITYVSNALEKICGYSSNKLKGSSFSILTHPDMDRSTFKDLWETISLKKTWIGELKNRAQNDTAYWMKSTIAPEIDENGNVIGYISYSEDITNQKSLEKEKIKTQNALEFKSSFLSNMSHEIRTPLNGVIGLTGILLKTGLNEKQIDIVSKVQSASNILLGVINDILDISKIEAGKMTIENSAFNLKESIGHTTDMLLFKAQEKNIDLDVIYKNMPNNYFIGDSLRISQVLTNLINNSIKFTEKGGVRLDIEKIANDTIRFEVTDSGIGLKPEQIKTLFQEFTQADMSTSRKYGGTGLGLSICKNLVEMMGGHIKVSSEYGKGSTFSFELPIVEVQTQEETQEEAQKEIQEININSDEYKVNAIENKKILIAEDNKMNQMVVSMLLEDSQIDIDFALDGEIAVQKAKNNTYDLILMDIQMPNMNGYEATKTIRQTDSKIPIVALSANVMKEDIEQALESGMNDTLAQPINMNKLYTTLLKYLNSD